MTRLTFEKIAERMFYVKNNREVIALIYFYEPWGKYVFESEKNYVHDLSCLNEVTDFMRKLN